MSTDKNSPDPTTVDRLEIIDETGRAYVRGSVYGSPVKVELSYQDDGRTLKVFVTERTEHDATDPEPSTSIASMPSEVDTLDEILAIAFGEKAEAAWNPSNGRVTFPKAKAKLSAREVAIRKAQITEIRDEWAKWLVFPDDDPNSEAKISDIVDHCDLLLEELEKQRGEV